MKFDFLNKNVNVILLYFDIPNVMYNLHSLYFQVYKGVVHEYPDMVQEFCSGPVIALEITSKENIAVPAAFRETCGPADPVSHTFY